VLPKYSFVVRCDSGWNVSGFFQAAGDSQATFALLMNRFSVLRELRIVVMIALSKLHQTPVVLDHTHQPKTWPSDASLPATISLLIVDDEPHIRELLRQAFARSGFRIDEANNGVDAIAAVADRHYDVMLLDMELPRLSGEEVLRRVRGASVAPHLKVIALSGKENGDALCETIFAGADDFVPKPFSILQLRARVSAALRLKQAQDRADLLNRRAATANSEMEQALAATGEELLAARGALVMALAKLVEARSHETGPHLIRVQTYTRILSEAASAMPAFLNRLTPEVRRTIEQAAPLHDIGKVAIPDVILNKPGRYTPDEFEQMKAHAAAGADTLAQVRRQSQFASAFLHTAEEIARHHHEKWNGTGYPDQLRGEEIPLSARVTAIADVYDALRSPRVYKKAYTHEEAVDLILTGSPGHFDPGLLGAFALVHPRFAAVFDETVG
jgi:putative two-component system response regulator